MSQSVSDSPPPPVARRLPAALWILLTIALGLAAMLAWKAWSARSPATEQAVDLSPEALDARLLQAEAAIASLRRSNESLNQKLTDTRARTGLLRDEVLAVSQRSSLLEDSVRETAGSQHDGIAAARLDEVELLLTLAQQRLRLSGDLPGAVRATELAQGVLATQRDPALVDLRQSLAQELGALRALPENPSALAAGELDALEAMLPRLAAGAALSEHAAAATTGKENSGLQRLLSSLVRVRRSGDQDLLSPTDRSAGESALSLEIALARSALASADQTGFRRSLQRIDNLLQRLFPDSAMLRERRQRLARLRAMGLQYQLPIAGSTLAQLQALQRSRRAMR